MERRTVYMDYNATTALRPEVKAEIVRDLDVYANASSMHEDGRKSRVRVEQARTAIAKLVGATDPQSIIFTSGGSESNNTVFATMFHLGRTGSRRGIVTTKIEHPCVLNAARWLESEGFPVVFLDVDEYGTVNLDQLARVVGPETLLVSVMAANNEIGTVQDMRAIHSIVKNAGAYLHSDATQSVGKIPVDVESWGVDYLTMSGHKLYGPKGVGALYLKKGAPLEPLIRGGHQEHGYRAGTYNNIGILGFGVAAELAQNELDEYVVRVSALRDRLRDGILSAVPKCRVNGNPASMLPNTLNVSFPGAEGEAILLSLDLEGIRVSTGSACASGSLDPSHVLLATGVGPELAHGSIRFSLGRDTTIDDVDYVISKIGPIIARLRSMSTVSF
ncbi:MAG: cysteine desulfurase [Spirochaetales bacterium]|nr:cysteine desulfurase [Spirochaetales bacterium]